MSEKPKGIEEAKRFLDKFPIEKKGEALALLNRFGYLVQGIAVGKAPVGISGRLKNDIIFQVRDQGEKVEGQLGFSVFYAKYVHGVKVGGRWLGPKRHFVPFRVAPDLERWARLKGVSAGGWKNQWGNNWAKKSGRDISKMNGMWVGGQDKANPFLHEAAESQRSAMITAFKELAEVNK